MSEFLITAPDGKQYRIQGETAEGAARALHVYLAQNAPQRDPRAELSARMEAARNGTLEVAPESAARANAADTIAQDEMTLAADPVRARMFTAMQGLPFAGEYFDEAMGKLAGEQTQERIRNVQGAMERQRPGQALGLQIGTGIVSSLPAAAVAAPAAAARTAGVTGSILGRTLGVGAAASAAGAVEGAVSGYGRGRNNSERRSNAITGGAFGGIAGGVLGGGSVLVGTGLREVLTRVKRSDVGTIARELGVNADAARVIKGYLESDDLVAAEAALRRAGDDAMLADAGPATRQALDDAMASGGQATRIGVSRVEARANAMQSRVTQSLDAVLGRTDDGLRSVTSDIGRRSARVRDAAYTRAYSTPIDYAADTGRAIEGVLDRIPARTLNAAIQDANEAMQEAGERNLQILAQIADDGTVTFREMPNVRQLDYLKRALGSIAENETDAVTGKISDAGRRARRLSRDLRDAIGEAVPSYRTAVRLGGDNIEAQNAAALGRRVLNTGVTREDVLDLMRGASVEAKDAFRRGLRLQLDDLMGRATRTAADPNADAREVIAALKAVGSRNNRTKLVAALGEREAGRVLDAIEQASAAIELRSGVARGAQTAIRTAGQRAVRMEAAPGAAGSLARGEIGQAGQRAVQFLTNTTPQAEIARERELFAQVADALTRVRGRRAQEAVRAIREAMDGQPIAEDKARRLANFIASSGALSAYQTTTQSLESR